MINKIGPELHQAIVMIQAYKAVYIVARDLGSIHGKSMTENIIGRFNDEFLYETDTIDCYLERAFDSLRIPRVKELRLVCGQLVVSYLLNELTIITTLKSIFIWTNKYKQNPEKFIQDIQNETD